MNPFLRMGVISAGDGGEQGFAESQTMAGLAGLAIGAVFLAVAGRPELLEGLALVWLAAPLIWAGAVRLGLPLGAGEALSVASFAGLVTYLAALTGGLDSFLLAWFALIPAEAALARDRRMIGFAAGLAAFGLVLLFVLAQAGVLPTPRVPLEQADALAGLATLAALVAASAVAARAQSAWRTAEEAKRSEQARHRFLADNAGDLITYHRPNGLIAYASPSAQTLLGMTAEQLEDATPASLAHADDRMAVQAAFLRATYRGEDASVEFRMRHASGEWRWVEMRCRAAEGEAGGVIAVTRDISARKRHEAELVAAREQAESASRAKSRFLANMSHELRTPLNAVIGFSEMIRQQMFGPAPAKYVEYARLINESGVHLLDLINDVLDMSKIEAGKFAPHFESVALSGVLADALQVVRVQAEKGGVRLAAENLAALPPLTADRRAVKQILLNLLSNAIKFTPEGGSVEVTARAREDGVELCVADTGIGIAEADLARLGRPFEQVDGEYVREKAGTGLGLALVRALAALHGGEVAIASALGQGTQVRVRLPLVPPQPESGGDAADIALDARKVVYPARFRGVA